MCEAGTTKGSRLILSSTSFLVSLHFTYPVEIHLWIATQATLEPLARKASWFPEPESQGQKGQLMSQGENRLF